MNSARYACFSEFYVKNSQPLHPKDYIELDLAEFKTENNDTKYDVKIEFSYDIHDNHYPYIQSSHYDVQYEDDDEKILEHGLGTKIFLPSQNPQKSPLFSARLHWNYTSKRRQMLPQDQRNLMG